MRASRRLVGAMLAGAVISTAGTAIALLVPADSAQAQEQKTAGNTVRPEIGKPVQAALDQLKHKHGKDALAKVRETDAVPNKTPYEVFVIEQIRGQAAAIAGDASAAAQAFEATAASSAASANEKRQFLGAATGQYYLAKNYGKAVELGARYFKEGGADKSVRTTYVQALYLGNDFGRAAKEMLVDVQAEEAAGKAPAEVQLQLLADSYQKLKDQREYANALEKLLVYYPKRDYWLTAIYGIAGHSGFSERLALDFARLKLATGTMRTSSEYLEAAQLSLQEGLPAEAQKIVDQGYAAGLLGSGAEAERHRRLKDMAARNLVEDNRTLGQDDAQAAAAKDGNALLNSGLNYVLHGKNDKGLDMMEQGLRKGGLKRPDDARLLLGYAYYVAGRNAKAVQTFKTVHGGNGAASLARLWVIHLQRGS